MAQSRVSIPLTLSPGAGLGAALAAAIRPSLQVYMASSKSGLHVDVTGPACAALPRDSANHVLRGAALVFQQIGHYPRGLSIRIESPLPPRAGFALSAASLLAGVLAANRLSGGPFAGVQISNLIDRYYGFGASMAASLRGGLATGVDPDAREVHSLPAAAAELVLVIPRDRESVALRNAARGLPALLPSMRSLLLMGLAQARPDLIRESLTETTGALLAMRPWSPLDRLLRITTDYGAQAWALSGAGPALIFFAGQEHYEIEAAAYRTLLRLTGVEPLTMRTSFQNTGPQISEGASDLFAPAESRLKRSFKRPPAWSAPLPETLAAD